MHTYCFLALDQSQSFAVVAGTVAVSTVVACTGFGLVVGGHLGINVFLFWDTCFFKKVALVTGGKGRDDHAEEGSGYSSDVSWGKRRAAQATKPTKAEGSGGEGSREEAAEKKAAEKKAAEEEAAQKKENEKKVEEMRTRQKRTKSHQSNLRPV
eukprot:g46095.t1